MNSFPARTSFVRVALPVYLWAGVMITVSSIPGKAIPEISLWQWDKLAHVFEYAVLAGLLLRYLRWRISKAKLWIACAVLGIGFGITDEIHQLFVPMRFCTWQDLVADSAGVALGIWAMGFYYGRRERHKQL